MSCLVVFDIYRQSEVTHSQTYPSSHPYFLAQEKLYLVDFNPFCPTTDGLLFTWDELEQGDWETPTSSGKVGQSVHD